MVKNSQPKFQSVYDYLVRGIESGFYRPETRLPSERKLAEKLNVNVATVRRAFRDLITSGVVEKRIGDGTYLTRGGGIANGAEYVNIVLSNYQATLRTRSPNSRSKRGRGGTSAAASSGSAARRGRCSSAPRSVSASRPWCSATIC